MKAKQILVVGAGISGLVAARTLREKGHSVTLVDKSANVGGRMATRRLGRGTFDLGAQFFTARDPEFQSLLEVAIRDNTLTVWSEGFPDSHGRMPAKKHPRYRGSSGMVSLPKWLAEGARARLEEKIVCLKLKDGTWRAENELGGVFLADAVFLSAPVPQSLAILKAGDVPLSSADLSKLTKIEYHSCFALLISIDRKSLVPEPGGFYPYEAEGGEPIAWIADNQMKGISRESTALTIHAGVDFSREHFSAPPKVVVQKLLRAAQPWTGKARILETHLHRWRYSHPSLGFDKPFYRAETSLPLYFIGDAFGRGRVEGAALSAVKASADFCAKDPVTETQPAS